MGSFRWAALGALSLAISSCGGGGHTGTSGPQRSRSFLPVAAPLTINLSSPAFATGSRIPTTYTCAGRDVSPPLRWTAVPAKTKAIALLMIDPDAPGGPFTHWALAYIPPTTRDLRAGEMPSGAVAGRNGFGKTGYGGPCPPAGKAHHYVIELLALRRRPNLSPGFASGALDRGQPVAAGVLRGTFSRG
jgi:Raf kinase inhibitor-like YbhB/YbcL family protein